MIGCQPEAEQLADRLSAGLDRIQVAAARFPRRLRVFFEDWDDPLISGIRWVEELVTIAGGTPLFPELAGAGLASLTDGVEQMHAILKTLTTSRG